MTLHEEFASSLVKAAQLIEKLPPGLRRDMLLAKLSEARSLGDELLGSSGGRPGAGATVTFGPEVYTRMS